jgi:hypothetical protein
MPQFKLKINKKIILITTLVALLLAIVISLVVWYPFFSFSSNDTFRAVPESSALIVDIKEPTQFFEKIQDKVYQNEISNLHFIKKGARQWNLFYKALPTAITQKISKLTLAAQIGKDNDLDFIHILEGFGEQMTLEEYLAKGSYQFEKRAFNQQEYFIVHLDDSTSFAVALSKKLFVLAEVPYLVEAALGQLESDFTNNSRDKSLQKIRRLIGKNADATIFINMKKVPLFASFFTKEKTQLDVNFLQFFANWVGLDIVFQEKTINIDGYLSPTPKNQLLKSLKKEELPDKTLIASVLPDNTTSMVYIGFKTGKEFFKNINIGEKAEFEKYFLPWMSGEFAYLVTEAKQQQRYSDHQFAIFKTKDIQQSTDLLEEFSQTFGKLDQIEYFNYTINRILAKDIIKPIFGNGLNTIHNPYYVILNEYVVFCNSQQAIQELLDKYTYGQTLGQDINYLQFVENLSATSSMYLYVNTSNALNAMTSMLKEEVKNKVLEEFEYYQKLTPLGLQLTPYNDLFVINGQIKYNPKGKQATSVLWKTDLEADAAIAPVFVKNHKTQELEIFVQDANNKIYLIDRNGETLWSKQIIGRIQSDIHQIDYYKNTFLQYIFNTDSSVYLIDRNGEFVENFPVQVSTGITNGMLVVDYDNTRDYRYFLASGDGSLYGFKQDGTFLEGWSPKSDVGKITFPVQHFNTSGKDYLVALNEAGRMLFFQRNGEIRMNPVELEDLFLSNFGVDLSEPQRIVTANQEGKAYILNLNGRYFKMAMKLKENKNVQFLFSDVLSNHRKDYVVLSKKELGIFSYTADNDFKNFGNYEFNQEQSKLFEIHMPNADKQKIGTLSLKGRNVYLFNGAAKLFPDFPLSGTTPFCIADLYNDGINVLVVGNKNAIFAYKLKSIVF